MGIPKFYRYVCERYPSILERIRENQILEYDNFYLDMNGIIHVCCHPEDENVPNDLTDEEIFRNIFHYVDVLFDIIRPKKLFFLAVDGVAPRAKMNQQRGRRFRTAKEKENMANNRTEQGELSRIRRFDSNCITPGTEFMIKLQEALKYFVVSTMTQNSLWKNCKVILSGHEVPGEGEHKIMEYIRYMKSQPDYDPYTRHCLYGLDADLLVLGLCTHERNFSILREEVIFGRKINQVPRPEERRFLLTHLSLLREYLSLEFQELKKKMSFSYRVENIIDDWVLMSFILGNDFIPHLPNFHINNGALAVLYETYHEVLPKLDGYLNENGYLNLPRLGVFMEQLAKYEESYFEENYYRSFPEDEELDEMYNSDNDISDDTSRDSESCSSDTTNTNEDPADYRQNRECPNRTNDSDFARVFAEYKRNYYTTKMEFVEVTEEVLKSQAEGYIRGLQWILHYYYRGCQSWSWFYPFHYAPCVSDIVDFQDVGLDFNMGRPFLPYEQLLAVLPPGSKDLVPRAYQELMTSAESPIIEYYPQTFQTDLNGKQHAWEAVVLLPMIDETVLLTAMEGYNDILTPEEKDNNKHGPMLVYSYTSTSQGFYAAPEHFKDVLLSHASVEAVWRDEIADNTTTSQLNRINGRKKKKQLKPKTYFPGFPTFNNVDFVANKRVGGIKVFNFPTIAESVIIEINEKKTRPTEKLAAELLGKIVYVNWPNLSEARVVAIEDENVHYSKNRSRLKKTVITKSERSLWKSAGSRLRKEYLSKKGIEIGNVRVLVYVNHFKGFQRGYNQQGNLCAAKVWAESVDSFPLQTVTKNLPIYGPHLIESYLVRDPFPRDSTVFVLCYPYYGCMGKVLNDSDNLKYGRYQVEVDVGQDCDVEKERLHYLSIPYFSAAAVGKKIGISGVLVGKIAGNIEIKLSPQDTPAKQKSTINIGLLLKINKSNEKVPGYTKRDELWKYSNKAVEVMQQYVKKFPGVIDYLSAQPDQKTSFSKSDLFPDYVEYKDIMKIVQWIKGLECSQIQRVTCDSQIMEKESVKRLEDVIDGFPKEMTKKIVLIKPELLFNNDLIAGDVAPFQTNDHRLCDRIICIKSSDIVPLGTKGYIIGIVRVKYREDYMYDILFDTSFPKGMALNCSPGRGYRMSKTSFINISLRDRACQARRENTSTHLDVNLPPNLSRVFDGEQSCSTPIEVLEEKSDQYKNLWSFLEQGRSQVHTNNLAELLKIMEDNSAEGVEDNVENVSDNASTNTEKSTSGVKELSSTIEDVEESQQNSQPESDKGFYQQLVNYFQSRQLAQPTYRFMRVEGKIICQISVPDNTVYCGLPSDTEESALEDAAIQGLIAIEEEQLREEESAIDRETTSSCNKLKKGLFKGLLEALLQASTTVNSNTDEVQGSNFGDVRNLSLLPSDRSQWFRQYIYGNIHPYQYMLHSILGDNSNSNTQNSNENSMNPNWPNNLQITNLRHDNSGTNNQQLGRSNFSRINYLTPVQHQSILPGVQLRPDAGPSQQDSQNVIAQTSQAGASNNVRTTIAPEFMGLRGLTRNLKRVLTQPFAKEQGKRDK